MQIFDARDPLSDLDPLAAHLDRLGAHLAVRSSCISVDRTLEADWQ